MRFFSILKPGIIFGNLITLCGGFFLASHDHFDGWLFLSVLVGMALIIGAGCIFNNLIDRDIDQLMDRTKNRSLVTRKIHPIIAIVYAFILLTLGFVELYQTTNFLTVWIAFIGFFVYVIIYSICLKRSTTFSTIIGAISGAVPMVTGYTAVTNRFDTGALLLFLIMFLWQMPHFYAIAIYRMQDFIAADLPILPVKKGIRYTKICMLWYIVAFTIVAVLPSFFGYTGWSYGIVALVLGLFWLYTGIKGFSTGNDLKWARKMFLISIIEIMVLCVMMAIQ